MGNVPNKRKTRPAPPPLMSVSAPTCMSNTVALAAAGCSWGTEKFVRVDFQKRFPDSIAQTTVGFVACRRPSARNKHRPYPRNKHDDEPEQQQEQPVVSSTNRHHHYDDDDVVVVEVVLVELRRPEQHLEALIRFFFQFHDPTTRPVKHSHGFQYGSYIFCGDYQQHALCHRVIQELQTALDHRLLLPSSSSSVYTNPTVTTVTAPLSDFTPANEENKKNKKRRRRCDWRKHPKRYGGSSHRLRFHDWPPAAVMHLLRREESHGGDQRLLLPQ